MLYVLPIVVNRL